MADPVVSFTHDADGLILSVDASATTVDPGESIASVEWDWGDGSTNGAGITDSHLYGLGANYTVTCTVTDTLVQVGSTFTVVAMFEHSVVAFRAYVAGMQVIAVSDSTSDVGIVSTTWDWGDGSALETGTVLDHVYEVEGSYTITLTIVDAIGRTYSTEQNVTVAPLEAPPGTSGEFPAGPPPTPTTAWILAEDLAAHLDIPLTEFNEPVLDEACLAAQAWVMTRIRLAYTVEPIRPEILLATKYQAAKLFRRRQTPEGIAQVGDFGPMRVMGTDPDVEALLRAYKHDGFSGGPRQTVIVS